MIDWLRLKYRFLAAIHPYCWGGASSGEFDESWDNELWNMLLDGKITFVEEHIAVIGNKEVWIANYPYASGSERIGKGIFQDNGRQCSRATALFLEHEIKAARLLLNLKYTREEQRNISLRRVLDKIH